MHKYFTYSILFILIGFVSLHSNHNSQSKSFHKLNAVDRPELYLSTNSESISKVLDTSIVNQLLDSFKYLEYFHIDKIEIDSTTSSIFKIVETTWLNDNCLEVYIATIKDSQIYSSYKIKEECDFDGEEGHSYLSFAKLGKVNYKVFKIEILNSVYDTLFIENIYINKGGNISSKSGSSELDLEEN